jgi:hypothetical protein
LDLHQRTICDECLNVILPSPFRYYFGEYKPSHSFICDGEVDVQYAADMLQMTNTSTLSAIAVSILAVLLAIVVLHLDPLVM